MTKNTAYTIELTKTLYMNTYRGKVITPEQEIIAKLRIIPTIPLERSQVPSDAPKVSLYLLIIVDDADISKENIIDFEEKTSYALLKRFATETISPEHCEFYYPSPAFVFDK